MATAGDRIGKSMTTTEGWRAASLESAICNTDYPEYRNKSGFSANPSVRRSPNSGRFTSPGIIVSWWTSTEFSSSKGESRTLATFGPALLPPADGVEKSMGYNVRCVQD